ncbi:MAG: hypothetical protein FJX76_28430 [Armatimonadetes bacterium]|nr:hypothetical protein [Armatimonadota bacterium]
MHAVIDGVRWTRTSQPPRVVPSKIDPYFVGVWTGVVNGATIVSHNYPDGRFQQYLKNGSDLTFLQHGYNRVFAGGRVVGQFLSGTLADKGVMTNTYTVLSPDAMLLAPSTWTRVSRAVP